MNAGHPHTVEATIVPPDPGVRYFLVRSGAIGRKPMVFPSLPTLAARIHRERGLDELKVEDVRFRFQDEDEPRAAVTVQAIDVGGRARLIGHAYLCGRPAEALRAALEAQVPRRLAWRRTH